ncbi:MAG: hypothetical protein HYS87_02995 [Candidatus Colwellbacteria bacterium]|nr:hypothetical protein [Candidatus Colwellbacteria bacterium]
MIIGHKNIEKIFKKLAKENKLSHAYIFFGEPQVGKYTFASALASLLENNKFETPTRQLRECLILKPVNDSIGIEEIRDLKIALYQKPISSRYRMAIIDNADALTYQAQNAILKIAEEPPEHGLLVLISSNTENLLPTLNSRFQKIYFPTVTESEISILLKENYSLNAEEADKISKTSFGRPGRAIALLTDKSLKESESLAKSYLKNQTNRAKVVAELSSAENKEKILPFLYSLVTIMSANVRENYKQIGKILRRISLIKEYNTNKRMQLEAALN